MSQWISLFNNFDIEIVCITFLFLMYFNIRKNSDLGKNTLLLFTILVFSTILAALSDSLSWVENGNNGTVTYLANALYYIFLPIPSMAAFFLSSYLSKGDKAISKRRMAIGLGVYALLLGLNVANLITPLLFYVAEDNTYHRGSFCLAYNLFIIFMLIMTMFSVYKDKSEYVLKVLRDQLFWLPTAITGIIQLVFYGVNLYMAGLTISIFIYYTSLQAKALRLDYLTGVFNRRYFDALIQQKFHQNNFSMILIDVDSFKQINDSYGHVVGDEVLISVASLLKVSVHKNDFVARYGGDEFVVMIDSNNPDILKIVINRIQSMIDKFNTSNTYNFPVSISMGYDVFMAGAYRNARDFIKHIDKLMYLDKKSEVHQLSLTGEINADE